MDNERAQRLFRLPVALHIKFLSHGLPTDGKGAKMAKEKKSTDMYVELPEGISKKQMMSVVEQAAAAVGLYISHIGGYSHKKYPGSVHWHFKRDKREVGLIDATYWDVKSLFWLMVRHREPEWVQKTAPKLRQALVRELGRLAAVN